MSTLKIIILSALVSTAVVAAYGVSQTEAMIPTGGKLFGDRLAPEEPVLVAAHAVALQPVPVSTRIAGTPAPRGDRVVQADCSREVWPRISPDCMRGEADAPVRKPVRTITVETRTAPTTSVLTRVPATEPMRR